MGFSSKHFGYYLKQKRQQLGLSQADLANKTKVQRTSISRLESLTGNPQWSMIRLIAEEGMGISLAEFFQTEPREAKQPLIQVGSDVPGGKLAELMVKTQGKAIPVVSSETPLRSKVVTDQDISGYVVIDHGLLQKYMDKPLVVWLMQNNGGVAEWLLVDISDSRLEDGRLVLVDLEGSVQPRRAWVSTKGPLILGSLEEGGRPVAFWGRQKERIECLGRVVMMSQSCVSDSPPNH